MLENIKQAQANLTDNDLYGVTFSLNDGTIIDGVVLRDNTEQLDYMVGRNRISIDEEIETKRYIRLPKHIMEARHAVVEFYDNHEKLTRQIGATAIGTGIVVTGSLYVWRLIHNRKK